ncbi:MAG: hypothetical protein LBK75_05265, partial [Oscillospiraceae bacterium]|nr:hypothetical protein [Oscillospiraceae bacterium]
SSTDSQNTPKRILRQQYDKLQREFIALRSQFDEAVEISSRLTQLHSDNSKLSSELRTVKSEKEDLEHRLRIALQAANDASDRLSVQTRTASQQVSADRASLDQRLATIEASSRRERQNLQEAIAQQKADYDALKVNYSLLSSRLDHIIQGAQRYTGKNLTTPDDLVSYFNQPPPDTQPAQSQLPKPNGDDADLIRHLRSRLKKLALKLRTQIETNDSLQKLVDKTERDFQAADLSYQQEISRLNDQLAQLRDEGDSAATQSQTTISGLERKVLTLKSELAREKSAKPVPPAPQLPAPTPVLNTQRDKELEAARDQLLSRVSELTEQLAQSDRKQKELCEKSRQLGQSGEQTALELEKQKEEVRSLKTLYAAATAEIETLRASLVSKPDPPRQVPPVIPTLRAQNLQLQHESDALKKQLSQAHGEIDKRQRSIDAQEQRIRDLTSDLEQSELSAKTVLADLQDAQTKLSKVPKIPPELPPDVFTCADFPAALREALHKIAHNSSLQHESKIKIAYKAIASYFEGKLAEPRADAGGHLLVQRHPGDEVVEAGAGLHIGVVEVIHFGEGECRGRIRVGQRRRRRQGEQRSRKHKCKGQGEGQEPSEMSGVSHGVATSSYSICGSSVENLARR